MESFTPMEAVKHLSNRKSIRSFSDQDIPANVLNTILEAGLNAATGGNLQPYSIIVERDKAKNKELAQLNGNQAFIEKAAVNLIFVLDWYKYSIYAKQKNAPFIAGKVYMHYLIGVEDVICAAQTIESAAHLMGIGSCYVGTCNSVGSDLVKMYNLPKLTYPVVILSLGYPAEKQPPKIAKMPYDMMVFEGKYPDFTEEMIFDGFEAKYGGMKLDLPKNPEHMEERLDILKQALLTTYDPETVQQIVEAARKDGFVNETQRRFGLHYSAHFMYENGKHIMEMMREQGLEPFKGLLDDCE